MNLPTSVRRPCCKRQSPPLRPAAAAKACHHATVLPLAVACACLWLAGTGQAGETFRVATYNLNNYLVNSVGNRAAKTEAGKAKIREALHAAAADVVALQEVGGLTALKELRNALATESRPYAYWEHVQGWDTNIQVAVLSRFPIVGRRPHNNDSYLLSGRRLRASRGFAEVTIQVNSNYTFTLITTHLKSKLIVPEADQAEMRLEEARLLREKIDACLDAAPQVNLVVLGDLNDTKDALPIRTIIGRGRRALLDTRPAEPNGDDQPSANPRYDPPTITWTHFYGKEDSYGRIDYILLSSGMAKEWRREDTFIVRMPNWGVASDHRPIVAAFEAKDR